MVRLLVGLGSCGIAAGAERIKELLAEKLGKDNNVSIEPSGCLGCCYLEPVVTMVDNDGNTQYFVKVDEKFIIELEKQLKTGQSDVFKYLISDSDFSLLIKYPRIALRNCGKINPENIDDYIATGGYLQRSTLNAQCSIISEIEKSRLRGRGGAGFPVARKWQALKNQSLKNGEKKYIICNADEGDPGAFMDRSILEGDPHSVLEGMIIAGLATDAMEGIIYVRAEYPLAIKRLEIAIEQAREKGFLCKGGTLPSEKGFNIRLKAGAGAFVCGEETALIASLEGERGEPRLKPPFPFEKGYFSNPSIINNVETLSMVSWIIKNGGDAFRNIGVEGASGTKVFALTGKVKKGGLVEVPLGSSVREVIEDFGGGSKSGKNLLAVQLGGPSGGCIPSDLFDTPITYEDLAKTGAIMGSGGMVVMDEDACMVDMARFFLDFTVKESCGKCVSCRVGTKRMLEILERIVEGKGEVSDDERLLELAEDIKAGALCGLGQTAPNPVLTALKYFKDEFTSHIEGKKCKSGVCKNLVRYEINAEKCIGCTLCAKKCPTKAITGEVKLPHTIMQDRCIKCEICAKVCKFDAVIKI
ncbi:MAG: 4Fe-4S binding protein [Firmicutes bacterium]|nr:4Fe-4S binding protein [Bacillota bacterium]